MAKKRQRSKPSQPAELSAAELRKRKLEEQQKKHANWTANKLQMAARDDVDTIEQRIPETSTSIQLLRDNDWMLDQIRKNMGVTGRKYNISFEKAAEFIKRNDDIRMSLDTLNKEMALAMGTRYLSIEERTQRRQQGKGNGSAKQQSHKTSSEVPSSKEIHVAAEQLGSMGGSGLEAEGISATA